MDPPLPTEIACSLPLMSDMGSPGGGGRVPAPPPATHSERLCCSVKTPLIWEIVVVSGGVCAQFTGLDDSSDITMLCNSDLRDRECDTVSANKHPHFLRLVPYSVSGGSSGPTAPSPVRGEGGAGTKPHEGGGAEAGWAPSPLRGGEAGWFQI